MMKNKKLSYTKAKTVADALRARGISVHRVFSGGQEMPVASNKTDAGREKTGASGFGCSDFRHSNTAAISTFKSAGRAACKGVVISVK